jgi:hypothetical protein
MDQPKSKSSSILFKAWMKLGHFLGKINAVIILSVVYYVIVSPLGLAGRLFGVNSDKFKFKRDTLSYWVKREDIDYKKSMKNLY